MRFSAVILAGGKSRRMGRDKAWLELDGQPLILRAINTIRAARIAEIFVSGRPGVDYSGLGCPVVFDRLPGCGPVGGIERALESAAAPLTLVLAVDMARMTAAFLRQLARCCGPAMGVVPELNGELEPLAAIYPRQCSVIARDCLLSGRRGARDFAEACLQQHALAALTVSHSEATCFENWNTPSDALPAGPVPCLVTLA